MIAWLVLAFGLGFLVAWTIMRFFNRFETKVWRLCYEMQKEIADSNLKMAKTYGRWYLEAREKDGAESKDIKQ